MEHQRPDPERGSSSSQGARVEDDFLRPLTPMNSLSRRRLAASLPFVIVAILVVGTVAFGATVMRPLVNSPQARATPVVVGDDDPDATDTPAAPTAAPTAEPSSMPTSSGMILTAKLDGRKVILTWTAYEDTDFAYYKVVRSSDKKASWPLGDGDTLVAAISDQSKLTFTDCPTAGKTWSYEVFAVKSTQDGYVVLDSTNLATAAVPAPAPKPTPKPTRSCGISLSATVKSDGVHLKWTKFGCELFEYYVVVRSETNPKLDVPLPHEGTEPMVEIDNISHLEWTDTGVEPGHTYYYRVMVWNSGNFCNGGTVLAKSGIIKVTIPEAATPAPSESTAS